MKKELSIYSLDDRKRIARTVRRKVSSECAHIVTAGFALLMVVLFFFAPYTFLPISEITGVRPKVVWVLLSFGIASAWAWGHVLYARPRIASACDLDAAFQHQHQAEHQRQLSEKYKALRKDQ